MVVQDNGFKSSRGEARCPPGRPSHRQEIERQFWEQIATGITNEKAAAAVGVSQAVGTRWFRKRGEMPLLMVNPMSGRYLSFVEREEIALLCAQNIVIREIARRIGRSASTVSRELRRNAVTRSGLLDYRASVAQWKADLFAKRPKPAKLVTNHRLHKYVQARLEGQIHDAKGRRENKVMGVPRMRNSPPTGRYGAVSMANALKKTVQTLPAQLCRSLTWDRGK